MLIYKFIKTKMKIIFISVFLGLNIIGFTQKKQSPNYMIITMIIETQFTGAKLRVIITSDSKSQEQKQLTIPKFEEKEFDFLTLKTLKPYFQTGWKLVSTSSNTFQPVSGGESFGYSKRTDKYFLSKTE